MYPVFAGPKRIVIDSLSPDQVFKLDDRKISLDGEFLRGMSEVSVAVVKIVASTDCEVLAQCEQEIRLLPADFWGGFPSDAELLATFVTPNEPCLAPILKVASETLGRHTDHSGLDGYQSSSTERAYHQLASVWSAISDLQITYINPPRSFENHGQKIRLVEPLLRDTLATCLDSSLLFASLIESIGMNPVLILQQGHCFVGSWLVDRLAHQSILTECSDVRKAIDAGEMIVFETTLVTNDQAVRFADAADRARSSLAESKEDEFVAMIDIGRTRMSSIRPLGTDNRSGSHQPFTRASDIKDAALWDDAVQLPELDHDDENEKPKTPQGRIDRWHRKLLDLTLRNRLLNCPPTSSQTIPLRSHDLSMLEDMLSDGESLKMKTLPTIDSGDASDRNAAAERAQAEKQYVESSIERGELVSSLDEKDLSRRLTTLHRSAKSSLAEGGSNTLFMAIGFLKWNRPNEQRSYRAPLILMPITLNRKTASSPFAVASHDDETRFNATLVQMLKVDFDLDLSDLEAKLPTDQHGVDVSRILQRVRSVVRDIAGFEVIEDVAVSSFSFKKYLMWKDLVDRQEELRENRVVNHLIESPGQPFNTGGTGEIRTCEKIDQQFKPSELIHPLPADSSQLAAVMTCTTGKDFVLIGPPGTGKSQTIANMISQCLAEGKSVLFVAEKTAALDVVHRRLVAHGLGDCCIELHSSKADRKNFLEQIGKTLRMTESVCESQWIKVNDQLRVHRDELNDYVEQLHQPAANGWTPYQAIGKIASGAQFPDLRFEWSDRINHDQDGYKNVHELIDNAALTFDGLRMQPSSSMVQRENWSAAWQSTLEQACAQWGTAASGLQQASRELLDCMGLECSPLKSQSDLELWKRLAAELLRQTPQQWETLLSKSCVIEKAELDFLAEDFDEYETLLTQTAATFDSRTIDRIPVLELDQQWRASQTSFWPKSWCIANRVRKTLQSYVESGITNPASDILTLGQLHQQRSRIEKNRLASLPVVGRGFETDLATLQDYYGAQQTIRSIASRLATADNVKSDEAAEKLREVMINEVNREALQSAAKQFLQAESNYRTAWTDFIEAAGCDFDTDVVGDDKSDLATRAVEASTSLLSCKAEWKRWLSWNGARRWCGQAGLASFCEAMEKGLVEPSDLAQCFETAYAKWWLPRAVDASPRLQQFECFRHENTIEQFQRLDELARQTASDEIRRIVCEQLPSLDDADQAKQLSVVNRQMQLKRPSKSIRQVISSMGPSFNQVARCALMSPLSIAQYLPVDQPPFDVVIFDEASQITTWDAIGAISRGKQLIVVGDPKQLPPTNFFGRQVEDDDEEESCETDLESILDEVRAAGLPTLQLNWHYRSRDESLIAFSNWHYYDNKLITFPSPQQQDCGVKFHHLPNALYDRGKSRTNRKEAEAIVQDAVQRMKHGLADPESDRRTFGVITFNTQQQTLIQDLFEQARIESPEIEWYFDDARVEPTVVKNLESVQGDERDVMFFSITFGFDSAGRLARSFGALNLAGGERRLNVAVTRARCELAVYASFKAEQLDVRGLGRGVTDFKNFLQYADQGVSALPAESSDSLGGFDSPFEEAVANALKDKGWQYVSQVGVSGFRIDLSIVHPDCPGSYLAGIECDGATYHSSATARDRDKTRQQVLENLGWNIVRIWSTDWWHDRDTVVKRVDGELRELLQKDRNVSVNGSCDSQQSDTKSEQK